VPKILTSLISIGALSSGLLAAPVEGLLEKAIQAERWIDSVKIVTDEGLAWPIDPAQPQVATNLYSGTPGIVLFYLELYRATGAPAYLETAKQGARYLIHHLPTSNEEFGAGLYTGVGGVGFTLIETARLTGDFELWQGALRIVQLIEESAKMDAAGAYWNESTDIIGGSAGIALFLLYAAEQLQELRLLDLAASAGRSLMFQAKTAEKGSKWAMSADFPRLMPNFSHGTAGIAYLLAVLYQETGEKEFLDSALEGAEYLLSVANTEGGVCLIFHHEPDGEDLYYLGWCHGPVGTARLFYKLHQITGQPRWETAVKDSAKGILESGIPDQPTPGFWNNVSQCCGSAGVTEFFLDLAAEYDDERYASMAHKMARQAVAHATATADGAKWIQAEHRVQPDLLIAQIGYMQGASGIGMMLLRLDAFQRGLKRGIRFPDSPFQGK